MLSHLVVVYTAGCPYGVLVRIMAPTTPNPLDVRIAKLVTAVAADVLTHVEDAPESGPGLPFERWRLRGLLVGSVARSRRAVYDRLQATQADSPVAILEDMVVASALDFVSPGRFSCEIKSAQSMLDAVRKSPEYEARLLSAMPSVEAAVAALRRRALLYLDDYDRGWRVRILGARDGGKNAETLRQQILALKTMFDDLQAKITQRYPGEHEGQITALNKLASDLALMQNQLVQLRDENIQLRQTEVELSKEISDGADEKDQLEQQNKTLRTSLQEITQRIEDSSNTLEQSFKEIKLEKEQAENMLAKLRQEFTTQSKEVEDLKTKLFTAEAMLDAQGVAGKQQNAELSAANARLTEELDAIKLKHDTLSNAFTTANGELNSLNERLRLRIKELNNATSTIKSLETEHAQLVSQLSSVTESKLGAEQRIGLQQDEITRLTAEVKASAEKLNAVESKAQADLDDVRREYDDKVKRNEADMQALYNTNELREIEINEKGALIEKLQSQIDQLYSPGSAASSASASPAEVSTISLTRFGSPDAGSPLDDIKKILNDFDGKRPLANEYYAFDLNETKALLLDRRRYDMYIQIATKLRITTNNVIDRIKEHLNNQTAPRVRQYPANSGLLVIQKSELPRDVELDTKVTLSPADVGESTISEPGSNIKLLRTGVDDIHVFVPIPGTTDRQPALRSERRARGERFDEVVSVPFKLPELKNDPELPVLAALPQPGSSEPLNITLSEVEASPKLPELSVLRQPKNADLVKRIQDILTEFKSKVSALEYTLVAVKPSTSSEIILFPTTLTLTSGDLVFFMNTTRLAMYDKICERLSDSVKDGFKRSQIEALCKPNYYANLGHATGVVYAKVPQTQTVVDEITKNLSKKFLTKANSIFDQTFPSDLIRLPRGKVVNLNPTFFMPIPAVDSAVILANTLDFIAEKTLSPAAAFVDMA